MSYRGGFNRGDGPGTGKLAIFAGAGVLLVVVWVVFVLFLTTGGNEQSDTGGTGQSTVVRESAGTTQEAGTGSADTSSPNGASTGGVVYEAGGTDPESITPEDPEAAARDRYENTVPEGGATNEPGSYDPLGVDPEAGELAPRERERASLAAAKFVAAAYGYSGDDRQEYIAGINEAALSPEIYSSPVNEEIERYGVQVAESGTQSAAKLGTFEVVSATEESVEGYAYFTTAETYDRYGEVEGNEKTYRQKLSLAPYGSTYKVEGAEKIEET